MRSIIWGEEIGGLCVSNVPGLMKILLCLQKGAVEVTGGEVQAFWQRQDLPGLALQPTFPVRSR